MTEPVGVQERVLVDPGALEVKHVLIGGLPIVNGVLARLGLDTLVKERLGEPDPRCVSAPLGQSASSSATSASGASPSTGSGSGHRDMIPRSSGSQPARRR